MKKNLVWILVAAIILTGILYVALNKDREEPLSQDENNVVDENNVQDKKEDEIVDNEDAQEEPEEIETYEPTIEVGKKMPNFTLTNLEGKEVSLSDYEGKIVLVNFWATWCGFCDMEMPDLQTLDNENEDLVVLAVNVLEDKATVEKYIQEGGYDFEVVLDEDGKIAQDYLVSGFPASYFANKEGIFLGRVPGMLTYEQMNEILEGIREDEEYK